MKIILFANSDWYLFNYRSAFARFLREQGHDVILLSPSGSYSSKLQEEGFQWIPVDFSRDSLNPFKEVRVVWKLYEILKQIQPDILHNFTLKSILYGSLAAKPAKVKKVLNAVTGRGYLFLNDNRKANLARSFVIPWMRYAMRGTQIIFQNKNDLDFFASQRLADPAQCVFIPGSGVDVDQFKPDGRKKEGLPIIALCARMLWDKGIKEFVEAAQIVRSHGKKARMVLVGGTDPGNPSSVPEELLKRWDDQGIVEWWGWKDDMLEVYRSASVICLPSYGEGLARSLLEAAACGLPIIATDIPGCREIVKQNETGFLVPIRNGNALADSIMYAIDHPDLLVEMGNKGREWIIKSYSTKIINHETYELYL